VNIKYLQITGEQEKVRVLSLETTMKKKLIMELKTNISPHPSNDRCITSIVNVFI
jgi:hypothetical protein